MPVSVALSSIEQAWDLRVFHRCWERLRRGLIVPQTPHMINEDTAKLHNLAISVTFIYSHTLV